MIYYYPCIYHCLYEILPTSPRRDMCGLHAQWSGAQLETEWRDWTAEYSFDDDTLIIWRIRTTIPDSDDVYRMICSCFYYSCASLCFRMRQSVQHEHNGSRGRGFRRFSQDDVYLRPRIRSAVHGQVVQRSARVL